MATLGRWITNVVDRNVVELNLRINEEELPSELFRSKTLVKLTLGSNINFEYLPRDVSLPALKSLYIESIYEEQDFFERLLAGCPVLEELSIIHLDYEETPHCICSQTIKTPKVYYESDTYLSSISEMSIDASNLVSLDYTGVVKAKYRQVNFKSLVEAKLNLTFSVDIDSCDLTNLIIGIRNVQTMHLSPDTVSEIYWCCKRGLLLPVFNNLVNLSFGSYNKKGWKLLLYLLKQTPKLETLTIQSLDGYTDDVTLDPFQVKVLHVLGVRNTVSDMYDLRCFVCGTECLEIVKLEIKKSDEVDHDRISRRVRTILEAPKCNFKLEISYV